MKKNVTIALTAFLMFAGTTSIFAQDTTATTPKEKKSLATWLTKTPWQVGIGMNIIDDNQDPKAFEAIRDAKWSPYKFTLDKALVKGFGVQLAFFFFLKSSVLSHNQTIPFQYGILLISSNLLVLSIPFYLFLYFQFHFDFQQL